MRARLGLLCVLLIQPLWSHFGATGGAFFALIWNHPLGLLSLYGRRVWGAIFASACAAPAVDRLYESSRVTKVQLSWLFAPASQHSTKGCGRVSHLSETECLTMHWTLELRKSTGTQLRVAQITLCALAPDCCCTQSHVRGHISSSLSTQTVFVGVF